ncbi:hypothetical protein V1512DRAFT_249524 [Lipomyces arxii]|uniref:uncharacterized protein n=1 Tax=Lipomyces arxii TaxID=56418 RepID=UPI0034CE40DD
MTELTSSSQALEELIQAPCNEPVIDDLGKNKKNNTIPLQTSSQIRKQPEHAGIKDSEENEINSSTFPSLESSVFKIKTIEFYDVNRRLREFSIVLQNENGPCPLIALVNTLILSTPPEKKAPLSQMLTYRTSVNASTLIQLLINVLLDSCDTKSTDSCKRKGIDISNVLSLLPNLHTGLNINPKFDGTFAESPEPELFRAFDVDIVHGWVADPESSFYREVLLTSLSYEDAQSLLVAASELLLKFETGGALTNEELQTIEDGRLTKEFLDRSATQLTSFGLHFLTDLISPGRFAVLFRNDHFSTIYRHPDSKQMFMLVTDSGYNEHKNIVWESLSDVTGSNNSFFSGTFEPSSLCHSDQTIIQTATAGKTIRSEEASSISSIHNLPNLEELDSALASDLQMMEYGEIGSVRTQVAEFRRQGRQERQPGRAQFKSKKSATAHHGIAARDLLDEFSAGSSGIPVKGAQTSASASASSPTMARVAAPIQAKSKAKEMCVVM